MLYFVFQAALLLLFPIIHCSGNELDLASFSTVLPELPTIPGNVSGYSTEVKNTSETLVTKSSNSENGAKIFNTHKPATIFNTHKPVTKTRRVTEYPRNDEDRIDRTIYVNNIDEAFIILKREIEVYVGKNELNYSLIVLEERFEFRHLISISELNKMSNLHHGTIGLKFNQKLLLHNKFLHQFELWWVLRSCSHLPSIYINKCRVLPIESDDILINIATAEAPRTLLLRINNTTKFTKITGISPNDVGCYCKEHSSVVECSHCLGSASLEYLLLTIKSSSTLQLFSTSSTPPISIKFKLLDISRIISINCLSSSKDYISIDLNHEKTSLLLEFTPRGISNKTDITLLSCSTPDGRSTKKLCQLTERNLSLPIRPMTKLLPHENIIMNIKTPRSASYVVTYYWSVSDNRPEKVTQVIETSDRRYMGSACFNSSLVGCERKHVIGNTWEGARGRDHVIEDTWEGARGRDHVVGNTSYNRDLDKRGVEVEQMVVVCNSTDTPIVLCTPRLIDGPSHIGHVPEPRAQNSPLLLALMYCAVAILFVLLGCFGYKMRRLHLDRQCEYHTYAQPDCVQLPSLDYTGIEIRHTDHTYH
ncbi:uncharacterized protein LOC134819734 [Bolinopsis microptera]|uniref:uncharacterized protein LOC134819734 n=1 Tax=Bolinopsis microptera TaxID=2820187 RepID=UPI003079A7DA